MVTKIADAAAAYVKTSVATGQGRAAARAGTGFGDLLSRSLEGAVKVGRDSDQVGMQALTGQASLTNIVTATSNAEMVLQTVVSIRDRVVNALQEILRMPI
jgi:flagellar hook-basal body complex protein FliE